MIMNITQIQACIIEYAMIAPDDWNEAMYEVLTRYTTKTIAHAMINLDVVWFHNAHPQQIWTAIAMYMRYGIWTNYENKVMNIIFERVDPIWLTGFHEHDMRIDLLEIFAKYTPLYCAFDALKCLFNYCRYDLVYSIIERHNIRMDMNNPINGLIMGTGWYAIKDSSQFMYYLRSCKLYGSDLYLSPRSFAHSHYNIPRIMLPQFIRDAIYYDVLGPDETFSMKPEASINLSVLRILDQVWPIWTAGYRKYLSTWWSRGEYGYD
jgi:hypothetical protein